MGVAGVDHQRHPHGLESAARQLGPGGGGRGRQLGALDVGEIDPALLDDGALGEHP